MTADALDTRLRALEDEFLSLHRIGPEKQHALNRLQEALTL